VLLGHTDPRDLLKFSCTREEFLRT
jgi:hypothetical protein